jgi:hypothetical protein
VEELAERPNTMRSLIPLLLLCGCSSAFYVRQERGFEVRASSVELGDAVAARIPRGLAAAAREIPGAQIPQKLVLIVEEASKPGSSHGRAYTDDRIELEIDPALGQWAWIGLDLLVTHEIVHSCLPSSWHRLPAIIEEGVADLIAQTVEPGIRSKTAPRTPARLDYSREEFHRLSDEERQNATAFGCAIVRGVGLDRLRLLVDSAAGAPIPIESIMAAGERHFIPQPRERDSLHL